jgi:UDP:flavonoid glycosyltransferase YjiC (YdhE family)
LGTLLAAAAGAIPLSPPRLQPYLGPLAIPVEPGYARWRIAALHDDVPALTTQRQEAATVLQERHSWAAHQQRLKSMIGPPRPSVGLVWRRRRRHPRRVLIVSTNGVGMGHLTRQLAIARRLPPSIEPVFLTMSQAFGLLREFGFLAEYTPYHENYGGDVKHWNTHLARLLDEMIAFCDPQAVLFDGNYPFAGIVATRAQHPSRRFVWCRRALWRPNQNSEALKRSAAFDLILEPGELATRFDRGATRQHQAKVRLMPPIRLLDEDELWTREDAAAELGLDPDKPAVLLQLGSRNNFDLRPILDRLLPALHRVPGLQIVAADWLISERGGGWPAYVKVIQRYPLARYVRAFDFAIATPGYNAFHELAAFAVPAVFVANENPRMDDHLARAAFAERHGIGLGLRRSELYKVDALIARMIDEAARAEMRRAAARLAVPNGAEDAVNALSELTFAVRTFDQAWLHGTHRRVSLSDV